MRALELSLRAWLLTLLTAAGPLPAAADLLIVGGALKSDNAAVYRAFVNGLLPEGPVLIIPAASGSPARSGASFKADLSRYGVDPERIRVFPLAVRDDRSTDEVDESEWRQNAWDASLLEGLDATAGVWFTGGDQMRIAQTMLDEAGKRSPLLALVHQRLAAGAIIGGTSAGAAIMSNPMITGGSSFQALLEPLTKYQAIEEQESGRLSLHRGLGFLPTGLVDQHFDRKARLGRLARALAESDADHGFGIDEDTGLLVSGDEARVLGRGTVTVLDARNARFAMDTTALARKLLLSVAPAGSVINLSTLELQVPGDPTVGNEYFQHRPLAGGGMAFANSRLEELLGNDLLDNGATKKIERISLDNSGRALRYTFTQRKESQGWYLPDAAGSRYAVSGVEFAIDAVEVQISR